MSLVAGADAPQRVFGISTRDPLRDPLWGHIYLVEGFHALLETPAFRKLRWIMQLGPAHLVYPGATHTRAAHSLGVFHLSVRLMHSIWGRGAESILSPQRLRSFFAAALLHDVGHFPFTHALKELPLEDHEVLSGRLVREEPLRSALARASCDPDFTAAIIDHSRETDDHELLFCRSLLSGVLDPDKLDYLNRDARFCGVPYGIQDIDYIFSRLSADRVHGLVMEGRGISSVEALLFAKYLMYRSVYWHRDVRSATAMIKRALWMALDSGEVAPEELYGLDDAGLFSLLSSRSSRTATLAAAVKTGAIYQSIYEEPFDMERSEHRSLEDLKRRGSAEERLCDAFSRLSGHTVLAEEVVIDVPERVSFESNLWIPDEGVPFAQSSTVFSPATVSRFTSAIRCLRIFVSPTLARRLDAFPGAVRSCVADSLFCTLE